MLSLIRDFIVCEDAGRRIDKKIAGYHHFHAVQAAVEETLRSTRTQASATTTGSCDDPLGAGTEGEVSGSASGGSDGLPGGPRVPQPGGASTHQPGDTLARRRGGEPGDRRIGVVWHTQGSGKSLTMVFHAGRIISEPAMSNPTVVVITDRNDLDDQLFGTFSRCCDLLRQPPVQARSRADLLRLLDTASGGGLPRARPATQESAGRVHP